MSICSCSHPADEMGMWIWRALHTTLLLAVEFLAVELLDQEIRDQFIVYSVQFTVHSSHFIVHRSQFTDYLYSHKHGRPIDNLLSAAWRSLPTLSMAYHCLNCDASCSACWSACASGDAEALEEKGVEEEEVKNLSSGSRSRALLYGSSCYTSLVMRTVIQNRSGRGKQ